MLKHLVFALLLGSSPAYSANYQKVMDSTEKQRLVVDVDTVDFQSYIHDNISYVRIYATMAYIGPQVLPPFVVSIDVDDCLKEKTGILANYLQDGSYQLYYWKMNGKKMYDAQGQWLCGYAKADALLQLQQSLNTLE